ncbi:alpha/beta fold hydrolase [Pseudoalteromonas mariniglutinosa]|uniref:alpha/beta fold hydrolase n=1 Tax=Pseudoalteromonas mariniglutinosa TaxID=206042 RepID=UPI00384F489C
MPYEDVLIRNNVRVVGSGQQIIVLAHGFGCDQQMWRFLLPYLGNDYTLVLFDYVGSGASHLGAYSKQKYETLEGYAQDIIDICQTLDLYNVHLVGHSVSGIISLLVAQKIAARINSLIMVCPSPCFLNIPPDYFGGFEEQDLKELMDLMDKNYIGWAHYLAPLVTGEEENSSLTTELSDSFCSTNPLTAKTFAKATFFSDHRASLPLNQHPVLLLQSANDSLAAVSIGEYMHNHTPNSSLKVIAAQGHCLHMSHPEKVANAIKAFLPTIHTDCKL